MDAKKVDKKGATVIKKKIEQPYPKLTHSEFQIYALKTEFVAAVDMLRKKEKLKAEKNKTKSSLTIYAKLLFPLTSVDR